MDVIGVKYEGSIVNGRMEGHGKFTLADGRVYEGGFKDGMFHGKGTLTFPDGARYEAEWDESKEVRGRFFFGDGLEYGEFPNQHGRVLDVSSWGYSTKVDRRFYTEILGKIYPAGDTQLTDQKTNPLPVGCFDVGEGYLNPEERKVYTYARKPLREATLDELRWAMKMCRVGRG
eukprot:EC790585.1.p2 GENE.EC790585.1~~EC790585.1.p2  ORF type:complete len:174 (+),score=45.46 EC790585.1:39-560(+)